ncbi:MAG: sulfurtransferase [Saprospiraceae bacterium]|jgi:thiosulfate/3-mercaptopyruvate sulfurtransferase|nr:sulfurtransferase [Saprospiraceae bacterium]HRF40694.1 sulfurtransferase [Saprospiraceae bacterium]HRK79983.1 sulfurtransferase [Saprospiraceae bacterium]
MTILNKISTLIFLVLLSVLQLSAQQDCLSAEDFIALTKANPNLVIVDANRAKTYQTNHIKGAIHINHMDLYQEGEIKGLLKSPEELAAFFGQKGISEKSSVVLYDDASHKYTTRIYWTLKYLGATDVKILSKDMEAWKKVRLPLTTEVVALKPVKFTPAISAGMLATFEEVVKAEGQPGIVLVDSRNADEYAGKTEDSKGHIPGAVNLDQALMLTETGYFKPAVELKAIVEAAGITPDKEVIVYCVTGVRASVLYYAFKNVLGYEKVKVYDGSYNEWVAKKDVVN